MKQFEKIYFILYDLFQYNIEGNKLQLGSEYPIYIQPAVNFRRAPHSIETCKHAVQISTESALYKILNFFHLFNTIFQRRFSLLFRIKSTAVFQTTFREKYFRSNLCKLYLSPSFNRFVYIAAKLIAADCSTSLLTTIRIYESFSCICFVIVFV